MPSYNEESPTIRHIFIMKEDAQIKSGERWPLAPHRGRLAPQSRPLAGAPCTFHHASPVPIIPHLSCRHRTADNHQLISNLIREFQESLRQIGLLPPNTEQRTLNVKIRKWLIRKSNSNSNESEIKRVRCQTVPCSVKPERPYRSVIVFYKTRLPKVQWDTVQTDSDKYV